MAELSPSLCFYGDDFTGSTDALDALTSAKVRAALLLEPSAEAANLLPKVEAVGLAGMSRAMTPEEMEAHLPDVFRFLANLNPRILHYKVCSTFDSSPGKGSIGKAMEIGRRFYSGRATPIIVGAPKLGRYVAFGQLFARAGQAATIHRLDRHPVMSRHPVTPMSEADLRLHLAPQTDLPIELVSLIDLEAGKYPGLTGPTCAILFDTTSDTHLTAIGRWLDEESNDSSVFCVGSSAVEAALAPRIRTGAAVATSPRLAPGRQSIAVVSGSCSPVTAQQIEVAAQHDFALIYMNPARLADDRAMMGACEDIVDSATKALESGLSPLVYTSHGRPDVDVTAGKAEGDDLERRIGIGLGKVLADLTQRVALKKVVVAGGDTSGTVARALDLLVLQVATSVTPGAPLCLGTNREGEQIEIALKGGQMGTPDYFARVRDA